MHKAHWVALIAWIVYIAEPAAVIDRRTGQAYPTYQWVPKESFLYKDFCESRATEYKRQGQMAACYFMKE